MAQNRLRILGLRFLSLLRTRVGRVALLLLPIIFLAIFQGEAIQRIAFNVGVLGIVYGCWALLRSLIALLKPLFRKDVTVIVGSSKQRVTLGPEQPLNEEELRELIQTLKKDAGEK